MAIAMALGLLLLLPESVEAASKTYELRETVPVIGSNVSAVRLRSPQRSVILL